MINFNVLEIGVIINPKKVKNPNTGIANIDKPGIDIANLVKTDKVEVDKANKLGITRADLAEADKETQIKWTN